MNAPGDQDEGDPLYVTALARLAERGRFGIRLGLGRTRALLRRLGDPDKALRGVLIAGTNGKGSTQALVAGALLRAGYSVGQTPKPHLVSYRERILVNGRPISAHDLVELLDDVFVAADKIAARHGPATEFEILTAAAFSWFAQSKVEIGVIEVGLGGRLDATNAWQGGVSAITNVSLDHMEHLGPTIEDIAREKSHVIKRGDAAAVTGASGQALAIIHGRSRRVKVPLAEVDPLPINSMDGQAVHVLTPDGQPLSLNLLGRHQAANAAVAWAILDALEQAGIGTVDPATRRAAFATTSWPGRLELVNVPGRPTVLLDGAHNPDGVSALAAALTELVPQLSGATPTLLMGILANHWQEGMLDPLAAALPRASLVATRVPNTENAMDPSALAAAWGAGATPIGDVDLALDAALGIAARSGGLLVVCGSLYLVGYIGERLAADTSSG